jgi:hypothetical protein
VVRQARERVERAGGPGPTAIVEGDPGWHRGVLGIAASRLAREYHRPVLLFRIRWRSGGRLWPEHSGGSLVRHAPGSRIVLPGIRGPRPGRGRLAAGGPLRGVPRGGARTFRQPPRARAARSRGRGGVGAPARGRDGPISAGAPRSRAARGGESPSGLLRLGRPDRRGDDSARRKRPARPPRARRRAPSVRLLVARHARERGRERRAIEIQYRLSRRRAGGVEAEIVAGAAGGGEVRTSAPAPLEVR